MSCRNHTNGLWQGKQYITKISALNRAASIVSVPMLGINPEADDAEMNGHSLILQDEMAPDREIRINRG
jgi:hypothetical protein